MLNARLRLSVITLLVLTATVANGASTGSVLTGLLLNKLQNFPKTNHAKRQGSNGSGLSLDDFPVQCQPGCKLAVDTLNTCTQTSCLCTTAVDNSLDDCINCTVTIVPDPTVIQDSQKVFDSYNSLCKGTGVQTLSLTVATLASTSTGIGSLSNPLLPSSTARTTTAPAPQGPTTTITAVTSTLGLPSNTLVGTPGTTTPANNPPSVVGNDAVALPRASKAYVAVGFVIAFFMCLA